MHAATQSIRKPMLRPGLRVAAPLLLTLVIGASAPPRAPDHAGSPAVDLERQFAPQRALVEEHCGVCHATTRIAKSGGTEEVWADRIRRMIRFGATLPRDKIPELARYLATVYPRRLAPPPVTEEAGTPAE